MSAKKRTTMGDIKRVHIDRRLRDPNYFMSTHHYHPYYELCCIEQGACRFMIENTMLDVHEGDCLLIPPQLFHYTRYLFGPCKRCGIYFRLSYLDARIIALMPGDAGFFSQIQLLHIPEGRREAFGSLLSRMVSEEECDDTRTALALSLQLQELFLFCSRACSFLPVTPADIRTTDRQILEAARFINENFRQQLSSAEIAAAAGFSQNYLSRKFREAAGIGVHEYLVIVRLRSAVLELESTERSVTEIATRCGFSDSNYFKDVFKKYYGLTPREYRRKKKGNPEKQERVTGNG